jgi:hypothetical protein
MNNHSFTYTSIAMLAALVIAITMSPTNVVPRDAQSTLDAPSSPSGSPDTGSPTETGAADDGENFQQFMQCLFGTGASEEDITGALDGTSESTPTEQEIRDCFAPLYNTGSATGTTTTPGGALTGTTDAPTGTTDDTGEDEGESSADGGTSEEEGESED